MEKTSLAELIGYIPPGDLSYQEWCNVGMALKQEGYAVSVWDAWSSRDPDRYHPGECEKKWRTFNGASNPVTGGTVVQMAMEHGWVPERGRELDWDDEITMDGVVCQPGWIEGQEVREPEEWHPGKEVTRYIETLFEPGEVIGFAMKSRLDEDKKKYVPKDKGTYKLTAGEVLEKVSNHGDDIGAALGDYDPGAGAWVRFNPLDGDGVANRNVTEYRYALVESDSLDIEKQNSIIRELELPVAVLMFSGGKSVHAIVHIDAPDYKEYQKRVEFLYQICKKNGLEVDTQNKNPSRLSRLPGCVRGEKKQFIIDTNIGKSSWEEWKEWIEGINDDLPDPENLESVWDDIPELASCLIDGVLRKGHKMLIAGPSKAGKSYLLIELCIAIAEGGTWLQWACAQGKVMYVNLELDPVSCLHRFRDVYTAMGIRTKNLKNIDIWNLRGKSLPMNDLGPRLVRRAIKKNYTAIVIDPIYKVITGDENSADQMSKFCNEFDKICTELGCAVIYCHHHSKGNQGGKKSMDRASGSGVFARDPDALLDLIELETTNELMKQEENKAICAACRRFLDVYGWPEEEISQDDALSSVRMLEYCKEHLVSWRMKILQEQIDEAVRNVRAMTAWRIEGTLREFKKFEPVNLWFDYPIHRLDNVGSLSDIQPEEEKPAWQNAIEKRKKKAEETRQKKRNEFEVEFSNLELEGKEVSAQELAEKLEVSSKELLSWFGTGQRQKKNLKSDFEKYTGDDGKVYIKRIAE